MTTVRNGPAASDGISSKNIFEFSPTAKKGERMPIKWFSIEMETPIVQNNEPNLINL